MVISHLCSVLGIIGLLCSEFYNVARVLNIFQWKNGEKQRRSSSSGGRFLWLQGLVIGTTIVVAMVVGSAVAMAGDRPLNVLFISSQSKDLPSQMETEDGLDTVLSYRSGRHNLYFEYLDGARLSPPDVERGLTAFIAVKYAGIHFDAVVGQGWPAASFVARHREAFGTAQRIYVEISTTDVGSLKQADDSAKIILAQSDYGTSVRDALAVSGAKRIVVTGETLSPSGRVRISAFRKAVENLPPSISVFPQIDSLPVSELEPQFQGLIDSHGRPVQRLTFNKGL